MSDLVQVASESPADFSRLEQLLRRQLLGQMRELRHGQLVLHDRCGTVVLGEAQAAQDLSICVQVLDPRFYRSVAMNGSSALTKVSITFG